MCQNPPLPHPGFPISIHFSVPSCFLVLAFRQLLPVWSPLRDWTKRVPHTCFCSVNLPDTCLIRTVSLEWRWLLKWLTMAYFLVLFLGGIWCISHAVEPTFRNAFSTTNAESVCFLYGPMIDLGVDTLWFKPPRPKLILLSLKLLNQLLTIVKKCLLLLLFHILL